MKYPFNVYKTKVENHTFWVAECPALKGCAAQGETAEEALAELELNESEWLESAKKYGIAIPDAPVEQITAYSGKFTVRVAPYIHQEAAEKAAKQGVSLNQYINDAIVAQNSRLSAVNYIAEEVKKTVSEFKSMMFDTYASSDYKNTTRVFRYSSGINSSSIFEAKAPRQIS